MSIYKKKHNHFIEEAIKEAKKSLMNQKHGCVIVHNNTIISRGYNYRIYKCQKTHIKYSVHAEESALSKLSFKNVKKYNMYVVRIHDNELRISLPCEKCMNLINNFKYIKNIFYSLEELNCCPVIDVEETDSSDGSI